MPRFRTLPLRLVPLLLHHTAMAAAAKIPASSILPQAYNPLLVPPQSTREVQRHTLHIILGLFFGLIFIAVIAVLVWRYKHKAAFETQHDTLSLPVTTVYNRGKMMDAGLPVAASHATDYYSSQPVNDASRLEMAGPTSLPVAEDSEQYGLPINDTRYYSDFTRPFAVVTEAIRGRFTSNSRSNPQSAFPSSQHESLPVSETDPISPMSPPLSQEPYPVGMYAKSSL